MAITTQDGLVAAQAGGQGVPFAKVAITAVATAWMSVFGAAGTPGAGVLAGTSTTAGVVPTDATAGCPVINAFSGSNTGYLSAVDYGNTVACRMRLCDLLWKGGAYPFNANVTLASQPSYSSRVPNGDYKGTEIWLEAVTAFTGNQTITITYTNQDGVTGRSTGAVATGAAPILGRMFQMPLQAGDTGVQKIESVVSTVSTVGTFNVLVLRPLIADMRVKMINDGGNLGPDVVDFPVVFADSALFLQVNADGGATGVASLFVGVING